MAEIGILTERDRVELIDGEIVEMTPIGHHHAACVHAVSALLTRALGDRALVWPDLTRNVVEVFRQPAGERYQTLTPVHRGGALGPEAFPDVIFPVENILPPA